MWELALGGKEMNYTKGEWHNHKGIIETHYAPRGAVIAEVNSATSQWEANAHLIAAAPDMYEALRLLTNLYIANRGSNHAFTVTITPAKSEVLGCWKDAELALAKADGQ